MVSARNFFSDEQRDAIVKAISAAEKNTSGEIRLHLEDHCGNDVIKKAIAVFHKLDLQKTALRNAVLIYLAVKDKQFAIIADKGINDKVPENFWDNIKDEMQKKFIDGNFFDGLVLGIQLTGEQLKIYFPFSANDSNELSDEISFDE